MLSMWPFAGPSRAQDASTSSCHAPPSDVSHDDDISAEAAAAAAAAVGAAGATIPPLIICEGFLSAAQSVVWGNEFRTYLGVGHQQLVDQVVPPPPSGHDRRKKRRSGLGSDRPVVFAPIGPVSSLHDRACELFYALRGGTVDYGEAHARQHGHARFGRHYHQALCPSWGPPSTHRKKSGLPAHFLGHSLGGPTILKLQQLLRQGFFDHALAGSHDDDDHSEWKAQDLILSITSVSSPFRGTPLVYSLGSEPLPYPKVRMFSFGDLLSKLIHIAAFLDLPFFDAHADAWSFSARRRRAIQRSELARGSITAEPSDEEQQPQPQQREHAYAVDAVIDADRPEQQAGVRQFLRQLWKSDWAGGRDCAPWDCTFAERDLDRAEHQWGVEVQPVGRRGRTWYRSYAGGMTVPDASPAAGSGAKFHRPESYWSLSPLTYTAHLIGHFDYARLQPPPSFLLDAQAKDVKAGARAMECLDSSWWQNDGVVPLASQFHPFDCQAETCRHFKGMPASLPFGRRRKRPQSMVQLPHLGSEAVVSPVLSPLSPTSSETNTLVDVPEDSDGVQKHLPSKTSDDVDAKDPLLPPPATQSTTTAKRSMIGTARSAARIAYFTSLRAINLSDPPLVTPSEEELRSFLPDPDSSHTTLSPTTATRQDLVSPASHPKVDTQVKEKEVDVQRHLVDPVDNQWYTFEIDNLDHTSLCPFWTGSEVQKQFWTGMGLFLASVDRKVGFEVEDALA